MLYEIIHEPSREEAIRARKEDMRKKFEAFGLGVYRQHDLLARVKKFELALDLAAEMGVEIPIEEQGRMLKSAAGDFTT